MTILDEHTPRDVISVLRGDPTQRPVSDRDRTAGLRRRLDEGVRERFGEELDEPIIVRAGDLRATSVTSTSPFGRWRGVLVNQLIRLLATDVEIADPFTDALAAFACDARGSALLAELRTLDEDEHARLAADVRAHFATLRRHLGPLPAQWEPRSAVRAYQRLDAGQVILRDSVDLMIGSLTSERASIVLIDVTTAPLSLATERAMRYHALVQTLRTGVVPWRSAAYSTASAQLWVHEVDEPLLERAIDDIFSVLDQRRVP